MKTNKSNFYFETIEDFVDNFPFGERQCKIQIERDLSKKGVYRYYELGSNLLFSLEWKDGWLFLYYEYDFEKMNDRLY